jgi:hypothetical protein
LDGDRLRVASQPGRRLHQFGPLSSVSVPVSVRTRGHLNAK